MLTVYLLLSLVRSLLRHVLSEEPSETEAETQNTIRFCIHWPKRCCGGGRRIERERGKHRKHEDNGDKKRWHGHFASIDAKTIDGPAGEHE